MKRILTIQDISCLGKCSLTVALPIISAMGVETVILPTAVLSTHTMFKNFTCKDLSDQIELIVNHWKSEGVQFDAIYTGYLGTEEEIEAVKNIIQEFRSENCVVFVDPAMGDNGKLYAAFNEKYAKKNAELCAIGDVIVPNITEACFMTDTPYQEEYDEEYIRNLLQKLSNLGAKKAVLTGVSLSQEKTGVMGYDSTENRYFSYQNDRIPVSYHGTGDIFSSVSIGAIMNDLSLEDSFCVAADYTRDTIEITMQNPKKPWYGVDFEATIPKLVHTLENVKK